MQLNVYGPEINTRNPAQERQSDVVALLAKYWKDLRKKYKDVHVCVSTRDAFQVQDIHFELCDNCHLLSMLWGHFSVQVYNHVGMASNI